MPTSGDALRPRWDGKDCLWLGRRPLRQFTRLATSQVPILAALEKYGWALEPIPNPLRPEPRETAADLGARLHEAVKNLNREMPPGTIHFRDNRTHVWWVPMGRTRRR